MFVHASAAAEDRAPPTHECVCVCVCVCVCACVNHTNMCPWSTKAVISSTGIFVAIDNNTLYGSKLYIFFYAKIIRILRSCSMKIFPTINISKLNF